MISNGRKIDDDFLDFIAENDVAICISVPGVSTFKDQTGIDNIGHVLSLFDKAHERKIQVTANIAVTKKNLPELYENIAYPLLHAERQLMSFMAISTITIRYLIVNNNESQNEYSFWLSGSVPNSV